VYDEDEKGQAKYNFTYVDQIYDGLLKHGGAACGGDQLYAEEAGGEGRPTCVLVQAECRSAEGLCEVGCTREGFCRASGSEVWQ